MTVRSSLLVVALIVPVVRAHAHTQASSRLLCSSSTAIGVVRTYYQALNQHRAAVAKACLTAHYLTRLTDVLHVVDPDWDNVISARVVKITARRIGDDLLPPDVEPPPYRAVQVAAEVIMHYRRIGGSSDGLITWFIYVIKQRAMSPWRIADIGSGP